MPQDSREQCSSLSHLDNAGKGAVIQHLLLQGGHDPVKLLLDLCLQRFLESDLRVLQAMSLYVNFADKR